MIMAARYQSSLVFSRAVFGVEFSLFLKVKRLDLGQFQVSFTQDAQGYFEKVWLLSL